MGRPRTRLRRDLIAVALGSLAIFAAFAASPAGAQSSVADSLSTRVDQLLRDAWQKDGITPTPLADDSEFVRRVSLDIIGRVPTADEATTFLADTNSDKREHLVDSLLASAEYADYWASVYMDTLLGRSFRLRYRRAKPVAEYFRNVFATNRPYDQFVEELITAEGSLADNGATGFLASRAIMGGTIEQAAGATARLFLGVQIQCAQCHDHPYVSRFKQQDFNNFTAFFGHTVARKGADPRIVTREIPMRARHRPQFQKRLKKRPELIYAVTEPRFFDTGIEQVDGESRRQWLARAILSTDQLALVTVNRVWGQLLGRAILLPYDNLGYIGKSDYPPLLTELAAGFRASGYDHRELLRSVALSEAYQRSSRGSGDEQTIANQEHAFARAPVRPLNADQLFNSLVTTTDLASAGNRKQRWKTVEEARFRALREFLFTFDDDEGGASDSFSGNVPQGLLLFNGNLTNFGTRGVKGTTLARVLENPDRAARIEALFLSAYGRTPSEAEMKALADMPNNRAAFQDLFHALLTSTEFITNH